MYPQNVPFDLSIKVLSLCVFLEIDLTFPIIFNHHKNNNHKNINQVQR